VSAINISAGVTNYCNE